ncbi:MAG: hypothetical protein KDC87_20280, partial [Planctomycetes bacterium]|nr:hypothetical protein [Planctomycetota bacterium]
FISFRYAKNLVDGLGLVFNAGEHVEGYTNFLWVMILAGGMWAGFDPIVLGQWLGIGFFFATVLLLWRAAPTPLPIAAVGLALHWHSGLFASCGLETAMFTFLVTSGLVVLMRAVRPTEFALAGSLWIAATMTRPDGALFYALGAGFVTVLAVAGRSVRCWLAYAAPFVCGYLPYFLWKLAYYGYPLPNTFYAKSASEANVQQGLYYLRLYLQCYYVLLPALLIPVWCLLRCRPRAMLQVGACRRALLLLFCTLPFLAYVVWVGGDFMFARFCLPVTPALFLALQLPMRAAGPPRRVDWVVAALLVAGSLLPAYPAQAIKVGNPRFVGEERDHYPAWYVEANRILGRRLAELFAGSDLRLAIGGGQAMLAYYSEAPYVLELHGLTDEFIAHRKLERRGRVGHEKVLPLDHAYLRRRGVDLIVGPLQFPGVPDDRLGTARRFEFRVENVPFGSLERRFTNFARATLLTYDAGLLTRVTGRQDVRFGDFPRYLDEYRAAIPSRPAAEVRADLRAFDAFYFEQNDDQRRRTGLVR